MYIELNFLSCNSFLSQMADTSMTILSQDLFRKSFLVHQAELQLIGVLSSLLFFSWNLCNFNSSNIVLMDLGFSLITMLKKRFFFEAIEAVWIQYLIVSHQFQTNQAAYLPANSFAH